MTDDIREIFEQAGCEGALCVQPLEGDAEFGLHADEPVVPASVVKVQVAMEAETSFADGRLDPCERVTLSVADRTPGPVGISLFNDDVELSWRDMVVLMLTISDNRTTDALLRRVGVDALNVTATRLGLTGTVIECDCRPCSTPSARISAVPIGGTCWPGRPAHRQRRWHRPTRGSLPPAPWTRRKGTRTTPCDRVDLLRLIWTDRAGGPAAACERVRALMARQLTRHRIASGFRLPVRVAAKSGSLVGVIRNEIGVISYPDGRRYAAAVFTRSRPGSDDAAISRAIGAVTAQAVTALQDTGA